MPPFILRSGSLELCPHRTRMNISSQFYVQPRQSLNDSDAHLMQQIGARQEWALELLFKRYVERGIRTAQRVGVDYQTAEDIVVDAFLKIWNHAEKFQAVRGSFGGWFHRVVHNLAIDELRRTRSRGNAERKAYNDIPGRLRDTEGELLGELDQMQVRAALDQLPPAQQQLLQMAYLEGFSRREIAKRLALPLGTVHTRMRLGKEKLKHLLQENGQDSGYVENVGA